MLDVARNELVYHSGDESRLPAQMVVTIARERHLGLVDAFIDSGTAAGGNMDIGGSIKLNVAVIHLVAVLIGEHGVDVVGMVDDDV